MPATASRTKWFAVATMVRNMRSGNTTIANRPVRTKPTLRMVAPKIKLKPWCMLGIAARLFTQGNTISS